MDYSEYTNTNGIELDMCIICAAEFKADDKVSVLPCNIK